MCQVACHAPPPADIPVMDTLGPLGVLLGQGAIYDSAELVYCEEDADAAVLLFQGLIRHFRPEMEERIGAFSERIKIAA